MDLIRKLCHPLKCFLVCTIVRSSVIVLRIFLIIYAQNIGKLDLCDRPHHTKLVRAKFANFDLANKSIKHSVMDIFEFCRNCLCILNLQASCG